MSYNRVAVENEILKIASLLQAGEKRIPVSSDSVKEVGFTGKGYWWRASNGMKNVYDGAHAREKFIHSLGQELGNTGKALALTKELEGKTASVVIAGDKIEVKSVVVDRVEGPNALCVKKTYTGKDAIEKASKALSLSRHTVDHSGYDKHDVVVTWEDGKVLKTRYDLERDYSSDTLESQLKHVLGNDAGVRLASVECKASELPRHK